MLRVLFVDDEKNALDALRRTLRPHQGEWEMQFLDDPSKAVQACEAFAPDVVITDLKMRGTDGISLLSELIRRGSPAVKVVMSGLASERAFVETLGVANQYLLKPVDRNVLVGVIQRAKELKEWLERPEVRAAVTECAPLPTLPHVYQQIVEAVRREASLAEIGEIAAQDPSITASVLQIANSAYFAPRHPISSVKLAASFLGLELLRPIVLFASLGVKLAGDPVILRRLQAVWRDSLEVAQIARAIAVAENRSRDEAVEAFSLGILHDIGSLAISRRRDPVDLGSLALSAGKSADEIERDTSKISHCDVGACILNSWGLPDNAVAVAAWHHDARRLAGEAATSPTFFVAAAVAYRSVVDAGADTVEQARLKDALREHKLSDRFDQWRQLALAPVGARE
jgi:HD-like signal output (HDOD) protein